MISGATVDQINLAGNAALQLGPSGFMSIDGNYIGLNHDASAGVGNATTGINAGAADEVSIGHNTAEFRNHISAASTAISTAAGGDVSVADNAIGNELRPHGGARAAERRHQPHERRRRGEQHGRHHHPRWR